MEERQRYSVDSEATRSGKACCPETVMKFLHCTCSRLLYGQFISGDGNFHLVQRRNHAGTGKDAVAALMRKASMIGDGAFWAPKSTFESYLEASVGHSEARPSVSHLSVRCPLPG